MSATCTNCDCRVAKKMCLDLPTGENLFCLDCAEYHLRIKKFKTHRFEDYISKDDGAGQERTCGNCEESLAKFVCDTCEDECKYLCLGCSILHTKVKIYRNHKVQPLYAFPSDASKRKTPNKGRSRNANSKEDGVVKMAPDERKVRFTDKTKSGSTNANDSSVVEYEEEVSSSYLDQLVEMSESISDRLDLWMRADDLYSRSVLIAVCLVAFLLLKAFAGKMSTIILIAIALILILMRSRGNGKQIVLDNEQQQGNKESMPLAEPSTNIAKSAGRGTSTHPLSYHQGPPGGITGLGRKGMAPMSLTTSGMSTNNNRGNVSMSGASGGILGMNNMESPSFSTESGHLNNMKADASLIEEFKEEFWHTTITESRAKKKNMKVQIKERVISC